MMRVLLIALLLCGAALAQQVPAEMCGRWTYLSGGQGSYMSSRTLVLHENGTYEYSSDTSSSGANGCAYGGDSDSGTWYVQGDTIIANSQNEGPLQLPFAMYPNQNGDIVLELDGDVYVR